MRLSLRSGQQRGVDGWELENSLHLPDVQLDLPLPLVQEQRACNDHSASCVSYIEAVPSQNLLASDCVKSDCVKCLCLALGDLSYPVADTGIGDSAIRVGKPNPSPTKLWV